MSPYRVLVKSSNGGAKHVMASALSVDKKTGVRRVYIKEMFGVGNTAKFNISDKELAHRQAGKRNSHIHAFYEMIPTEGGKRYWVIDRNINNHGCGRRVGDVVFTMSEGLEVAMNHYCLTHDLEVIQLL